MTIPYNEEENTQKNKHQDERAKDDDLFSFTNLEIDPKEAKNDDPFSFIKLEIDAKDAKDDNPISTSKLEIDPQEKQETQEYDNQNNSSNNNNILVSEYVGNEEETSRNSGDLKLMVLVSEGLAFAGIVAILIYRLVKGIQSGSSPAKDLQSQQQATLAWIQQMVVSSGVSPESVFSPYETLSGKRQFTPQARSAEWLAFGTGVDMTTTRYRVMQRYVLGVLYFSLQIGVLEVGGEGDWTEARKELDLGGYLTPGDECIWRSLDGVVNRRYNTCDSSGFITSIYFDAKGMSGTIPSELSFLHYSLSSIEIEGLNLQGSIIPTELGRLTQMQNFVLRGGGVGDNITRAGNNNDEQEDTSVTMIPPFVGVRWSQLERFQLVELDLHGTIPTELGLLTLLHQMDLSRNQLTGVIPTEFGNLTKLTKLTLRQNNLVGEVPTDLGMLAELKSLSLMDNRLTGSMEFLCDGANAEAAALFDADLGLVECSCCPCCENAS